MTYRLTDSDLELIRNVASREHWRAIVLVCFRRGQASCRMETVRVLVAKRNSGLNSRANQVVIRCAAEADCIR